MTLQSNKKQKESVQSQFDLLVRASPMPRVVMSTLSRMGVPAPVKILDIARLPATTTTIVRPPMYMNNLMRNARGKPVQVPSQIKLETSTAVSSLRLKEKEVDVLENKSRLHKFVGLHSDGGAEPSRKGPLRKTNTIVTMKFSDSSDSDDFNYVPFDGESSVYSDNLSYVSDGNGSTLSGEIVADLLPPPPPKPDFSESSGSYRESKRDRHRRRKRREEREKKRRKKLNRSDRGRKVRNSSDEEWIQSTSSESESDSFDDSDDDYEETTRRGQNRRKRPAQNRRVGVTARQPRPALFANLDQDQTETLIANLLARTLLDGQDPGSILSNSDQIEEIALESGLESDPARIWIEQNINASWFKLISANWKGKIKTAPDIKKESDSVPEVPEVPFEIWALSPAAEFLSPTVRSRVAQDSLNECRNAFCRRIAVLFPGPDGPNTLCQQCHGEWAAGKLAGYISSKMVADNAVEVSAEVEEVEIQKEVEVSTDENKVANFPAEIVDNRDEQEAVNAS